MSETPSTAPKHSHLKQESAYYEAHQQELLERYPEQWIAISDQEIIGVAPDPRDLLVELKNKGNPLRKVLVKHLTAKEEVWILLLTV